MGIAVEVARVEGAMLDYGWKSRHGQYNEGYTEEYKRFSDYVMSPNIPWLLRDTQAYAAKRLKEIQEKLKK